MSSWSRISICSAASWSLARFEELRHVCCAPRLLGTWGGADRDEGEGAYQEVAVLLFEAMEATSGIFGKVLSGAGRRQRRMC